MKKLKKLIFGIVVDTVSFKRKGSRFYKIKDTFILKTRHSEEEAHCPHF